MKGEMCVMHEEYVESFDRSRLNRWFGASEFHASMETANHRF